MGSRNEKEDATYEPLTQTHTISTRESCTILCRQGSVHRPVLTHLSAHASESAVCALMGRTVWEARRRDEEGEGGRKGW